MASMCATTAPTSHVVRLVATGGGAAAGRAPYVAVRMVSPKRSGFPISRADRADRSYFAGVGNSEDQVERTPADDVLSEWLRQRRATTAPERKAVDAEDSASETPIMDRLRAHQAAQSSQRGHDVEATHSQLLAQRRATSEGGATVGEGGRAAVPAEAQRAAALGAASLLEETPAEPQVVDRRREDMSQLFEQLTRSTHTDTSGPSEAERRAAEETARLAAERRAAEEAERRAAEEAERCRRAEEAAAEEAERRAAEEAERRAAEEAARLEAERRAVEEAERCRRAEEAAAEEAERRAADEAERRAAEEAARHEAERRAADEADRRAAQEAARHEAERRAAEEADRRAAEEAARHEAERRAADEAERRAADEAARHDAERRAAAEAERRAAKEAARLEAERRAADEADRHAAKEAARREAERRVVEELLASAIVDAVAEPDAPATVRWRRRRREAVDLPPLYHFKRRRRAQQLLALTTLVLTALLALVGYDAYLTRSATSFGITVVAGVLALVVWTMWSISSPPRLWVVGGLLHVDRTGDLQIFDLRSRYLDVTVVPRRPWRRWKVVLETYGYPPYTVNAAIAKPREFMRVLRYYRRGL